MKLSAKYKYSVTSPTTNLIYCLY